VQERQRQIAEAQARGGCVPASTCIAPPFTLKFPEACFPTPAERNAVINEIKAAEIEAAILEQVVEEATKPESNAPEAEQRATDAAARVEAEQAALKEAHDAVAGEDARAAVIKAELSARLIQLRQDRDQLRTLQRSLGIV